MKAFEYSGIWWLPTNPQNTVSGMVKFSNEHGIELNLIGTLLEDLDSLNTLNAHPVILGLSGEGREITLNDCVATGVRIEM